MTKDNTVTRNSSEVEDTTNVTAGNKDNTLTKNDRAENITIELERHMLARSNMFNKLPQADVRNSALGWIIHGDPIKLNASDPNLHQRFILALLDLEYGLDS